MTSARCLKLEPSRSLATQRQHLSRSLIIDQHLNNRSAHVTPQSFSSQTVFLYGHGKCSDRQQRPNTTAKMWAHPSSVQTHTFITQIWITSHGTVLLHNRDLASLSQSGHMAALTM